MKKNPYTLIFGKEPLQTVSRAPQMAEILENFREEPAPQQIYMITGVRGSGKTVFMTEITRELRQEDDWVIVELNPAEDLLKSLASSLASEDQLAQIFQKTKINLSFFGFGLEVDNSVPITDIQVAVGKMLESLKRHHKRVLVCIDEVTPSAGMKIFAGAFQIFVRGDLPIFLLMTGLYENISNLQNEENLTFLYRAPKIELKPLNLGMIAGNYERTLGIDGDTALKMARLTRGYSFAFQVLGYYTCRHDGDFEAAIPEVRQYLEDYVYEKIWSEMSQGDRMLAVGLARSKTGKAAEIKEYLGIEQSRYAPYRDRLVKRGILNGSEHGFLRFTLPMFEEYVLRVGEE